jgi:hypothetical protein
MGCDILVFENCCTQTPPPPLRYSLPLPRKRGGPATLESNPCAGKGPLWLERGLGPGRGPLAKKVHKIIILQNGKR